MSITLSIKTTRAQEVLANQRFNAQTHRVIKIGKIASAEIHLDGPSVSRVHAVIELGLSRVTLVDMGAKGGTLVNNKPVHRTELNDGDQVTVGDVVLWVSIDSVLKPAQMASPYRPASAAIAPASPWPPPSSAVPQAYGVPAFSNRRQALLATIGELPEQEIPAIEAVLSARGRQLVPALVPPLPVAEIALAVPPPGPRQPSPWERDDDGELLRRVATEERNRKLTVVGLVTLVIVALGFTLSLATSAPRPQVKAEEPEVTARVAAHEPLPMLFTDQNRSLPRSSSCSGPERLCP